MALPQVPVFNQFTRAEAIFLATLADHVYTDGQLIIGDSSTGGIQFNTLTAGAGIVITNGHGTITITAAVTDAFWAIGTGGSGAFPDSIYNINTQAVGIGTGNAWTSRSTLNVRDALSPGAISETFSSIADGGSGYSVSDVLTVTGPGVEATIIVTSVDGGGAITGWSLNTNGTEYNDQSTYPLAGGTGSDGEFFVSEAYEPIQSWLDDDGNEILNVIDHGLSPNPILLSPRYNKYLAIGTNGLGIFRLFKNDDTFSNFNKAIDLNINALTSDRSQSFQDKNGVIALLDDVEDETWVRTFALMGA